VTAYNPGKDSDGSGAKLVLDLLADILKARLFALQGETVSASGATGTASGAGDASSPNPPESAAQTISTSSGKAVAAVSPGEAWSSESLDTDPVPAHPTLDSVADPKAEEPSRLNTADESSS